MTEPRIIPLRAPCPKCQWDVGRIEVRGGQNVVRCDRCETFCYNAPRTETGETQRSVSTVHAAIKPSQRARIIERATALCELCGDGGILHVGHILSVDEGLRMAIDLRIPLTERDLNDDANLCCLCEECNLGMGRLSFEPRLYVALLWRRTRGNI